MVLPQQCRYTWKLLCHCSKDVLIVTGEKCVITQKNAVLIYFAEEAKVMHGDRCIVSWFPVYLQSTLQRKTGNIEGPYCISGLQCLVLT